MRGKDQVGDIVSQQHMITGRGFAAQHIQPGTAQMPRAQGVRQGRFINQATAGGIDQQRPCFHLRQKRRIYQLLGLCRQRTVQAQHIGPGQQLVERQAPLMARSAE